MNCHLCNEQKVKFHLKKRGVNYFKCFNCGLVQQYPLPDSNQIIDIYNGDRFYFMNQTIGIKEKTFYSIISPYLKNKEIKILDIGASTGLMLLFLRSKGYINQEGIDLSSKAVDIARSKFNLNIKKINIFDANYCSNSFDFIITSHIIEHLKDPIAIYEKINKFLKMDGVLLLATPNASCFNARLVKNLWRYYIPNEHIFLFNHESITFLLNKVGFEVLEINDILYKRVNSLRYIAQLVRPVIGHIFRKITFRELSNNFHTSRDGMIVIARKIKNL